MCKKPHRSLVVRRSQCLGRSMLDSNVYAMYYVGVYPTISPSFPVLQPSAPECPPMKQGSATNQHPSNHSGESVHFLIPCHPPFLFAYEVIGMPQFLSAEPPHLSRVLPARCKNHSRMPKAVSV